MTQNPRDAFRTLLLLLLAVIAGACGPTVQTGFEDARVTMRVRTALVNDPQLGTEDIDVEVNAGTVELSGRVTSAELISRAEEVVGRVEGVRRVTSTLEVGPREEVGRNQPGRLPSIPAPGTGGPLKIIGLGIGGTMGATPDATLGNGFDVGPVVRLPPRNGWGPSLGFSWTRSPLNESPTGEPALATLIVRPVMAGIEYGVTRGRFAPSVSLVGGYAFNALSVDTAQAGPQRAIAVDNGLAMRAGASLWIDMTSRVGLNLFGGYRYARPTVTFASDSSVESHRVNADAVLMSIGVAYWIF